MKTMLEKMKEGIAELNIGKDQLIESIIRTDKNLNQMSLQDPKRSDMILVFAALTDYYEDQYGWDALCEVLPSMLED